MRETLGLNSETTLVRIREIVVFFRRKNQLAKTGQPFHERYRTIVLRKSMEALIGGLMTVS